MADISYTPTTWADGAEGGTPIDAAKLNNIESGIVDAVAAIGPNDTTDDGTLKAQIEWIKSARSYGAESITAASGFSVNSFTAKKRSGVVSINMRIATSNTLTAGTEYVVATISSDLYPIVVTQIAVIGATSVRWYIETDGSLHYLPDINRQSGNLDWLRITYMAQSA